MADILSTEEVDDLLSHIASDDGPVALAEKDGVSVRFATEDDLPKLRRFGIDFYQATSQVELGINYNQASLDRFLKLLINSDNESQGILLVAQINGVAIGVLGGVTAISWTDANQIYSKELFLWVAKNSRDSVAGTLLVEAFEKVSRECGASLCLVGAQEAMRVEELVRAYKYKGYKPLERVFVKEL